MAFDVSVQKLKNELYRVLWNANGSCRIFSSSFTFSSPVDLRRIGVEELYRLECSINLNSNTNDLECIRLKLKMLSLDGMVDEYKQRKVTARFIDEEKEMIFTSKLTNDSTGEKSFIAY